MYYHPYLEQLKSRGIIPGLNRIRDALFEIGEPQKNQRGAIIAGTNGKGSTSYTLHSLLCKHRVRAALYTSPHILEINERYKIDNTEISDVELNGYIERLIPLSEKFNLTLFEFETLIAFYYFKDLKVEFSIYEVGMGGRLDATNCFNGELKIITNISEDHKEFLGDTTIDILREKAGIIKDNNTVVSGVKQKNLRSELVRICNEHNARLYLLDRDFFIENISSTNNSLSFDYTSPEIHLKGLTISLSAAYQIPNVAVALTGFIHISKIHNYRIEWNNIRETLKELRLKGRFEILSKEPLIIFDGAHNIDGIQKLKEAVLIYNTGKKKILCIFSSLKNKEPIGKLKILKEITDHFIFVPNPHPLACSAGDYCTIASDLDQISYEIMDIPSAISKARCDFSDHLILITGSLYIYREVYNELTGRRV